jgi:ribose transport system ATP-binding protein
MPRQVPAAPSATRIAPSLELTGVSKRFTGVQALSDVSLSCYPGELHALVGENGSGKSTLIKIASGTLSPDQGSVRICGQDLPAPSPLLARRLGLLTAYQDTSLLDELTVVQNVVLSYPGIRRPDRLTNLAEAASLIAPFELPFGPSVAVGDLSPGSKQLLEVVKALIHQPQVLLLDEPTAALDSDTIARLERYIGSALRSGTAVLYITHRLDEVERAASRLSVLRDGVLQGHRERGEGWSADDIVALMVGAPTSQVFPPKADIGPGAAEALEVSGLQGPRFGPIDLCVRRGEIVGIAGAEGNGQRELVRSLAGLLRARGSVKVAGVRAELRSPRAALAAGITFQSGDRAAESIFAELSVMENSASVLRRELGPAGLVMRSRELARFRPAAAEIKLVAASPDQPIRQLSGGNQQKAVLARSLMRSRPLIVIDEPTQGVDARARLDIYRTLRDEAESGHALLVSSSDSAELAGLCDRVYVLSRGRVVAHLTGEEVREDRIVDSFVRTHGPNRRPSSVSDADMAAGSTSAGEHRALPSWPRLTGIRLLAGWTPLACLILLIIGIGAYTQSRSSVFLSGSNLSSLFVTALPLAIVALGQQLLLLAGGFDISVGSNMSLAVVIMSFLGTSTSALGAVPGVLACLAAGVAIGILNAFIVRVLEVNAVIATIATLGIIQGVAILLRNGPGGVISPGLTSALASQAGFLPVAFLVVIILAVLAEFWRVRATGGLFVQAGGLDEESARRNGIRVNRVKIACYIACAIIAALAGVFLAVQVGTGSNAVGASYALPAFAACFIGGARLTGGKGSFVGALLGAVFLTMLTNIGPLLNLPDATSQIAAGILTIVAVIAYAVTGRRGTQVQPASTVAAAVGPSTVG